MHIWRRSRSIAGNLVLDLLWNLGLVQPERGVRRGWHTAAVVLVWAMLIAALFAGWVPLHWLVIKQTIETWIAVIVLVPIAAVLVLIALAGFLQVALLVCRGQRTMATVVATTGPAGIPKFQFTDTKGETHVVDKAVASVHRSLGAGQQVSLIYLPSSPQTFVLDRFADKWGLSLMLLFVGLIPLSICLILAFGWEASVTASRFFPPAIFLIVGGFFGALSFPALIKNLRFRRASLRTVGVITESTRGGIGPSIERKREEGSKILVELSQPEEGEAEPRILSVEFKDAAGILAEVSKTSGLYEVGDRVPIRYDPGRPWETQTDTLTTWLGPLLVSLFAAAMLVVGLCWLAIGALQ